MKSSTRKPSSVTILVEDPAWRKAGQRAGLRRAANLALALEKAKGTVTILLTDDASLKRLNREFRGANKPTNVLSFPASENPEDHLGDIAIAHGVTAREAKAAGKTFADHAAHLTVHGVLHLLGYDHETEDEAKAMEALEIAILARLGIADPYAARAAKVA